MPRLAVCSRDLHWHWINWTLLCDTNEVSMLRLAWLSIAQHVFQPALTGRLELISRKIVSSEQEQTLSRWADFAKNCLPRIECKELPRFREKYRALGRHVCKISEISGQKNGVQQATAIYPISRYTRPRYIRLTLYCPMAVLYVLSRGLFYKHGSTLILAGISNHIPNKLWDWINELVQERCNSSELAMELRYVFLALNHQNYLFHLTLYNRCIVYPC